ncbi:unnamed protein product [Heterobilharzia americana]|nr:unnamed protein product [Heterobilharzia americana]
MKELKVVNLQNKTLKRYIVEEIKEKYFCYNSTTATTNNNRRHNILKLQKLCIILFKTKFANRHALESLDVPSLFAGVSFFNFSIGLIDFNIFPENFLNSLLSTTVMLLSWVFDEKASETTFNSIHRGKDLNDYLKPEIRRKHFIYLLSDFIQNLFISHYYSDTFTDVCIIKLLTDMLNFPDEKVVQRSLVCLICLSRKEISRQKMVKLLNIHVIMKILSHENAIQKRLSTCLMYMLSAEDEYLRCLSSNPAVIPKLLSLISNNLNTKEKSEEIAEHNDDAFNIIEMGDYFMFIQPMERNKIYQHLASFEIYTILCLEKLMKIRKCQKLLRNYNGITIVLNCLKECLRIKPECNNNTCQTIGVTVSPNCMSSLSNVIQPSENSTYRIEWVYDLNQHTIQRNTAICLILSELAVNDFYAKIIARENGIHLIASQLLIKYSLEQDNETMKNTKSKLGMPFEAENQSTSEFTFTMNHSVDIHHLYANAFCALRRLFVSEHNRRLIKSFLPSSLLSELVEIDITSRNIEDYKMLINLFESLNKEEENELKIGIISCDVSRAPVHFIREYSINELLGTGAYGKVYKALKEDTPSTCYAIKEVSTSQVFLGKSLDERQKCIDRVLNEVNIIRQQLRHPNIVRYYKTFLHSDQLYIVMELLEGVSLTELLASTKEKKTYFSESRVWNIFVQLLLAIRYLHNEKQILHRDLSSNNIMISEGDKATITDFGLAYHRKLDLCETKSTVGTLIYACPEMIQNLPYGEGVDIWALGCILYQMCTFISPFHGECILSTASRIVKGEYESIRSRCQNQYSHLVDEVIKACLNPDPIKRPNVTGVAVYLTSVILSQLDASRLKCSKMKARLKEFQSTFTCDFCCSSSSIQKKLDGLNTYEKYTTVNNISSNGISILNEENTSEMSTPQIRRTVVLNKNNLREINDPILDMVSVMHKLGYLCQELPLNINSKYHVVQCIIQSYQRLLFAAGIQSTLLKSELFKLASYSCECVNSRFLEANIYTVIEEVEKYSPDLAVTLKRTKQIDYAILMYLINLLLRECTTYFSSNNEQHLE